MQGVLCEGEALRVARVEGVLEQRHDERIHSRRGLAEGVDELLQNLEDLHPQEGLALGTVPDRRQRRQYGPRVLEDVFPESVDHNAEDVEGLRARHAAGLAGRGDVAG